jgi:hypothetical protein
MTTRTIPTRPSLTPSTSLLGRRRPPLVKIHAIPARLLILDHLEVLRAQPKRLQYAVAELAQLAPHLGHLGLLGGLCARGQVAQLGAHKGGVRAAQGAGGQGGERAVVLLGGGEAGPGVGVGAGAGAAEEGLCADAEDVGGLRGGRARGRGRGGSRGGAGGTGADDFFFDGVVVVVVLFTRGIALECFLVLVLFLLWRVQLQKRIKGRGGSLCCSLPLLELQLAGGDIAVQDGAGEVQVARADSEAIIVPGEGGVVVGRGEEGVGF